MVNVPISAHCSLFCKRSGVIQDLVLKKKKSPEYTHIFQL